MTRRFKKKRPSFITLPRHKRSNEVIRLKGRIKRDSDEYGGMFTSHLVLDEPGRPDLYNQWFEFYFPGQDRFTIWNAEIVTARKAFWDAAHELAYQRTTAMLTLEEHAAESNIEFEPADFSRTGKVLSYRLIERKKMQYEKFSGSYSSRPTLFSIWACTLHPLQRVERLRRGRALWRPVHGLDRTPAIDEHCPTNRNPRR
jgi:hypothetical protein